MKKRVFTIFLCVIIAAIGALAIRLFVIVSPQKSDNVDVHQGVSILNSMNSVNVNKTESDIRAVHEKYEAALQRKKLAQAVKAGNYKYVFKDVIISGDSIVEAISGYSILNSSNVIAKVGAGTVFLNEKIPSIVSANPKYLVLHYGENQISTKPQAKVLSAKYAQCIRKLKSKLPDTKIYVDGIFPVQHSAYKQDSYLRNISYYNSEFKKMSENLGVTYLDYQDLWASAGEKYYDGDGIHPTFSFYTEQYLPFLIQKSGIGI
jgi:hypothetical protein